MMGFLLMLMHHTCVFLMYTASFSSFPLEMATFWTADSFDQGLSYISFSGALNLILAVLCKNKDLELDCSLVFTSTAFTCSELIDNHIFSIIQDKANPNKARSVEE